MRRICEHPDCGIQAIGTAWISINGGEKKKRSLCQMHLEAAREDKPPIKSATVYFAGDRSVGIHSATFNVELWADLGVLAFEDHEEYLLDLRTKISDMYEAMHGEKPTWVMFDFESEALKEQEPVTELMLCEVEHLFLHPNQLYRFIVGKGCKRCQELAEKGKLPA